MAENRFNWASIGSRLTGGSPWPILLSGLFIFAGFAILTVLGVGGLKPKAGQIIEDKKNILVDETLLHNSLGDFSDTVAPYVAPINGITHLPEFRTRSWVIANQAFWTDQVINVEDEDIVKDYLTDRPDRHKFYYFMVNQNNQTRYVLIYGLFKTKAEADIALHATNFKLPSGVDAFVEQVSNYVDAVIDAPVVVAPPPPAPAAPAKLVPTLITPQQPVSSHAVAEQPSDSAVAPSDEFDKKEALHLEHEHKGAALKDVNVIKALMDKEIAPKDTPPAAKPGLKSNPTLKAADTDSASGPPAADKPAGETENKKEGSNLPAISDPF